MRFLALYGLSGAKNYLAWLGIVWIAATLVSCGGGSVAESHEPGTTMSPAEIAHLSEPRIEMPEGPPPKRLVIKNLKRGRGRAARVTDELVVNFVGAPYRTGQAQWQSRDRLEPFVFHLGAYDVVPGWEQGLKGMRVGGRRELIVPKRLAGSGGARIYVVDLLAAQTGDPPAFGAADGPEGWPKVDLSRGATRKLSVEDLHEGSGPLVKPPAEVVAKLYGVDHATGESFLNAWGPDRMVTLPLRNPRSIWTRSLSGMRVGGRRTLIVPARMAFGDPAFGYLIEPVAIR
jgi:peptidylprolyl isomerase